MNKWLVKSGADVTVYTTDIDGKKNLKVPLNKEVLVDGVKVVYFPVSFRPWIYSENMQKALQNTAKEFDVIHETSVFLSTSTLGAWYAKKFKRPFMISPRGTLMKEPLAMKSSLKKKLYMSLVEKRNLKVADAIHFTSGEEETEYLEAKLPLKKAVIIPNGIDPDEFHSGVEKGYFRKKLGLHPDQKLVLFMSRINWKKGLDTLIPAWKMVWGAFPEARLVIAGGDDGYEREAKKLVKIHDLKDSVVFPGMLSGVDRVAALKDADAFVLPSYSENFGMAVVEALLMEVPTVITDGVAIWPEIKEANAGMVVRKTESEVGRALISVLGDGELRRTLKRNGLRLVEEKYLMEGIANRFLEAYNGLIYGR